jgi:hypothetical protein
MVARIDSFSILLFPVLLVAVQFFAHASNKEREI